MVERLSDRTLGTLASGIARPRYDRASVRAGIVHLGIGAFHRAHQAVYIDDCLAAGETDWGIVGASLRSSATRDALAPQDGLYTLNVRSSDSESFRVIGSVVGLAVAPEDPSGLVATLSDPAIRLVTLTVSEKAYLRDAAGDLDATHAAVRADLADPARPRSIFGFLVEALARRRAAGIAPFTILSCDNLPSNGETLHRLLVAHAALRSDEIARHVAEDVACPSSMVDRIVPATTDDDRIHIAGLLGAEDAWPVVTEPHSQWVVEDRFPSGRPSLETVGATMVSDVMPYEHMKLRLLNGSHSALAYLGLLSGHGTVATAFGDPAIRSFVHGLWTETIPTLDKGAGLDTDTYTASLTERYDNTALAYRTAQIAGDGSQKLPQRIVASALERVSAGAPDDHMATAVAAWVLCCAERGRSLPEGCFTDPADDRLATLDPSADATALTRAAFDIAGFAVGSVGRDRLADDVSAKLDQLRRDGVAETLRSLRDQGPSS